MCVDYTYLVNLKITKAGWVIRLKFALEIQAFLKSYIHLDFLGPEIKNLPDNAGDMDWIPGPRSHMPRSK